MSKKYQIKRTFLLTEKDNEKFNALAKRLGMKGSQLFRQWISENDTSPPISMVFSQVLKIHEKVDLIKKNIIRQNCPYCSSYSLIEDEKATQEAKGDYEVQVCQACQRKSLYVPENTYYKLVPYDFFSQQNIKALTLGEQVKPVEYKSHPKDLEQIRKILLEEEKIKIVKEGDLAN